MRAHLDLVVILAVSVAAALAAPSFKSLPSTWKTCKRADPKINECLRDAVAVAVSDLASKGIKDLGVFPIDPLVISVLDIDQGNGPVSIELHFKDLHIHGLKATKVNSMKADLDNYRFEAPVQIPALTLTGNYKINGRVLVLPITGEGKCELKLTNVNANVLLLGKSLKKDGTNFMDVADIKFTFDTDLLQMKFENLFNNNRQLGTQMNTFLNDNWTDILKELKPSIQEAFGAAFAEISSRIFRKIPYNKIFT